jgi:hypothetical protein
MTEQNITPGAADAEDTAGHVHWNPDDPAGPADSSFKRDDDSFKRDHDADDTEGHRARGDDEDDDTEGHARRA